MRRLHAPRRGGESGLAIVVVVLVLAALLILATPFLLSARNADRASSQLLDRGHSRVALQTAKRHGLAQLSGTHSAAVETSTGFEPVDETPWYDTLDEVTVTNQFDPEFYDANDPDGVMWDLEVEDLSGMLDMNSAPPQVFANVLSLFGRFPRPVEEDAKDLRVSPRGRFEVPCVLVANGEYMYATTFEQGEFQGVTRGVGVQVNAEEEVLPGPQLPMTHGAGAVVLDQRAYAPALWRISDPTGRLRKFDAPEQLGELSEFCWSTALAGSPGFGADDVHLVRRSFSVYSGVGLGREWQRAARLTTPVVAGETGRIEVDAPRWFNEGATVRISDGLNTEYFLVQRIVGNAGLELDRPLSNDYDEYETEVSVLSRRPVNVNVAPVELLTLLFLNLQMRDQNERVVTTEAEALAELVVESRPLTGHEDFLRRVVLPAAGIDSLPGDAPVQPEVLTGEGFISPRDAFAVYANALNANDRALSFSTMPFTFTSSDTYALSMRSSVNAPSGVERAVALRDEVHHVVPQEELLQIWAVQEHFDEALRLDREAPYWATGPASTSRYDFSTVPPSRLWAHLGSAGGNRYLPGFSPDPNAGQSTEPPVPDRIFATREDQGYAELWPYRTAETARLQRRMLHFDQETRDPEGRYLPDETITRTTDDNLVQWTTQAGLLCRPLYFSLWVKPRSLENSTLLDVAGTSTDVDRVSLEIFNGNLVVRVRDGLGDHPDTTLEELGEVRYPLAQGDGPGLPIDVWSHVAIDVRGNRPDQISVLVNGMAHGVVAPGLTRLTGSATQSQAPIAVDSQEGFRPFGCIRIGQELIEYTIQNGVMTALRQETGRFAGFGGRWARVRYTGEKPNEWQSGGALPVNVAGVDLNHEASTTVEQYGYSVPIATNVPFGGAGSSTDVGLFRVARAIGLEDGLEPSGDPIMIQGNFGSFRIGTGLAGNSASTGILLESADEPGSGDMSFMQGFNSDGGYAAVIQLNFGVGGDQTTDDNFPLGGIEVIRYSGYQGNVLRLASRGDAVGELANYSSYVDDDVGLGGRRAFVIQWDEWPQFGGDPAIARTMYTRQTFVVPISVSAPGATDLNFLPATNGQSQFAQFTHPNDAELTEWVRYDFIESGSGQLVRDGIEALRAAQGMLIGNRPQDDLDDPVPGGPGGGGGGGGGGGMIAEPSGLALPAAGPTATAPEPTAAPQGQTAGGPDWIPVIGQEELTSFPVSKAVSEAMQFRGVFGTYVHRHPAGTRILPVFRVNDSGLDGGQPGRLDPIFLVEGDAPFGALGWPLTVHWVHRPAPQYLVNFFDQPDPTVLAVQTSSIAPEQRPLVNVPGQNQLFVALQSGAPAPLTFAQQPATNVAVADSRKFTRMTCHPSGELPRVVQTAAIGSTVNGGQVPSMVVDEIVFGDTIAPNAAGYDPEETRGAAAVLRSDLAEGATSTIDVVAQAFRVPLGTLGSTTEILSTWPQDAGLLRIGEEILCYDRLDAGSGRITLAEGGRGLLGTEDQNHEIGEPLYLLENWEVTILTGGLGTGDHAIALEDRTGFPESSTLLIDRELIHYTRVRGNVAEMPRLSEQPGMQDRGGGGVFRGRFGTAPESHAAGTPVILFPFRYWDRWEEQADGPELGYFGICQDQPSAFWREMFFLAQETSFGGSRIGALVRTDPDVPWDSDPEATPGLFVIYPDDLRDDWAPIGVQSDRIEWRVFVDYTQGAFNFLDGSSHGWRQTPRFDALGVRFIAPNISLRSVEE